MKKFSRYNGKALKITKIKGLNRQSHMESFDLLFLKKLFYNEP